MDLHSEDTGDGGSSIEEDIRGDVNLYKDNDTFRKPKQIKKSKPLQAGDGIKPEKVAHTDTSKKFVTFGNTHVVESVSLSEHGTCESQEKLDLPGRVSFSKSDVYEIDFSDYENDEELLKNYSMSLDKSIFNKIISTPTTVNSQENGGQDVGGFCCLLKCNSMQTREEGDLSSTDKISLKNESSDQSDTNAVIGDYKKGIESLNRKHNTEIAEREEADSSSVKHDVQKSNFNRYGNEATPPMENINITKFYDDKTAFNNSKSVNLINLKSLSCNGENKSSNEVINNYIKITNQKEIYTPSSSKQNNLTKTNKKKKSNKPKQPSAETAKLKQRPGENLDEFQIEKVESWMSINEKSFSNSKCVESGAYNNEWRQTPNSKTDDEGNFSFEDPIDDVSNEESNYDEIVSVIKEIDEEKSKDLGNITQNPANVSRGRSVWLISVSKKQKYRVRKPIQDHFHDTGFW
ncbi:hypothetical protein Bhyg_12010 [Pseudolycoriella hygida]|uniref:Uncharacterized protein n=1 Tax=Pseudolycoriella hygida TaxID=35572 RepID=A0A9Q0MYS5_9DIPT|nr:hypothetical protein Bhyg_12010 [Pseudolycoriella hygida]